LPISPVDAVDPRAYGAQVEADIVRAGLNYDFTDALSFSYTYGYVNAKVENNGFSDFGPTCQYFIPNACVFSNVGISRNRTESHDARISFDTGGMFRASVGFLYSSDRDISQNAFATAPPLTAVPTASIDAAVPGNYLLYVVLGQTLTKNKISSPFAEVNVSLMDGKLRIGAEGRYMEEERYQQALASGGAGGVLAVTGLAFNATYNSFTPRFTVDYNLTPDNLLYASAAKGVKSGGFNTTAFLPANRAYDEDTNWTYEIGTKNTFGNFRFNANVFLVKWSNQQIPAADPGNPAVLPIVITLNLGNSTSQGVEFEGAWAATEHLTLNGAAYYGDATYDDGTFHLNFARTPAICDDVVCPRNGEISGNDTPRAPRLMATLGAEWNAPLGSTSLSYSVRGDVTHQTKAYSDEMNLAWVPSRTIANASIGLTAERYDLQLWVKNLSDEKYAGVASIQQPNVKYDSTLGERRTLGLTGKFRF
jgi:iron complex outermembrane recepter protein